MTVLVTGGSGFIGSYLVDRLARQGERGVILDLVAPATLPAAWTFLQADVRDAPAVSRSARGSDAIFHLAAAHHDRGILPETYFSVNQEGTRAVCAAAATHGIGRICFYSSAAVYGSESPQPDEGAVPRPDGPYGASKLEGERRLLDWCAENPARRALIIRPAAIIGPRQFANLYALIRQLDRRLFIEVGDGRNLKALGYVENLVDATLKLWSGAATPGVDVYNFTDKPDLTSAEIAREIRNGLGRSTESIRISYPLARLAALPFEAASRLLGRDLGVSAERIRKLAVLSSTFDIGKLLATGFVPRVTLLEGLRRTVDWYATEGRDRQPVRSIPPRVPVLIPVTDPAASPTAPR
jgi:nucleoside-diphosphate-sugar epimerase